jgi:hypothetical protein
MENTFTLANRIIRTYNLQNVKIINAQKNPYENKVPGVILQDKELYKSSLGTPVFSDITFGDKANPENNKYTDNSGNIISFEPVTFNSVLITVSRAKKIIKTEIQGRDGTVKEYIGQDDYSVSVAGIICGSNGHYPIDEVKALKQMLDAPIPIVITSWYLQNLDIDMLVVESYELGQDEGGYSYQQFSISCISDTPVELQQIFSNNQATAITTSNA